MTNTAAATRKTESQHTPKVVVYDSTPRAYVFTKTADEMASTVRVYSCAPQMYSNR